MNFNKSGCNWKWGPWKYGNISQNYGKLVDQMESTHLSLSVEVCLKPPPALAPRALAAPLPMASRSSTNTWGFSTQPQPLWTPTSSLRSCTTTERPSAPLFWSGKHTWREFKSRSDQETFMHNYRNMSLCTQTREWNSMHVWNRGESVWQGLWTFNPQRRNRNGTCRLRLKAAQLWRLCAGKW